MAAAKKARAKGRVDKAVAGFLDDFDALVEGVAAPLAPVKNKGGRPPSVIYTTEIADEICRLLATGHSLLSISKMPGMPSYDIIGWWRDSRPEFHQKCARARELQADFLVDDIQRMANETNETNVQSQKVKISVAQWRAMKMAPRLYGEKTTTEITGADGGPIQTETRHVLDPRTMTPIERATYKQLLLEAQKRQAKTIDGEITDDE